jgi:hypothetical protein
VAKEKSSKATNAKISFGYKKKGIARKKYGPKQARPKKYRGQGR